MQATLTLQVSDKQFKLYLTAAQINERINEMAQTVRNELQHLNNPLFVCMLSGSFVFAADFLRALNTPVEVQFVKCSSYQGTQSTGCLKEELGIDLNLLQGRSVIILEDIIETGFTMQHFTNKLVQGNPANIQIISLFYKPHLNISNITPHLVGFSIPDDFIVGYGLDYNQQGRNLPDVYSVV